MAAVITGWPRLRRGTLVEAAFFNDGIKRDE